MAEERLFDEQMDREAEAVEIFLTTKAARTALTINEFVQAGLANGVDPNALESMLLDDLNNNGRIFGEFRRAIKATAKGSINRVRDIGYFSEFGVDRGYRWSAILVKTCSKPGTMQGCMQRHGKVKTWAEWEAIGLPRDGTTICRESCHCVLVPKEYSALKRIKRKRKK